MYIYVTFSMFVDEFNKYNRYDNFGYDGLRVLYDYFQELEDDIGEPIELDVIGICIGYTRYENIEEYNSNYGRNHSHHRDIDETIVLHDGDSEWFIIQDY